MVGLPTFLPGRFHLVPGTRADYRALARFHYIPKPPATYAQIWTITYTEPAAPARPVAVAVLSYPTPRNRGREHFFNTARLRYRDQILFANAHVHTISRVIVHPQFRSLGLASTLVRHCCAKSKTRYTEAVAVMARAHPFFEHAGMTPVDVPHAPDDAPLYFIHDKEENPNDETRMTNQTQMPK